MAQAVNIKHASVSVIGAEACSFLQSFLDEQEVVNLSTDSDLDLVSTPKGLQLLWRKKGEKKPLKFHLDFVKTAKQLRSYPAPKQGAFNQALGNKTKTVIDATGGWGGDALLMCLQGYQVSIIERLPLMAILLDEAFSRLAHSSWAAQNDVKKPRVICANAADVLAQANLDADCVYLDPMYPPKRKTSAAANKNMQLLQWLAGPDVDAQHTAQTAIENFSRLAVKRPDYATPLIANPAAQFSSKLVHYDVYLNSRATPKS